MKYHVYIKMNNAVVMDNLVLNPTITLKELYHMGTTFVRCGKRNAVKTRFIVRDTDGNTLFWLYCRPTIATGEFVVRQSRVGYYKPNETTEF